MQAEFLRKKSVLSLVRGLNLEELNLPLGVRPRRLRERVTARGDGGWGFGGLSWHRLLHVGHSPDERAQRSAGLRGLGISAQSARRVVPEHCQNFDYILTMDEEHYRAVAALCQRGSAEVRSFLDYPPDLVQTEVPGPFYGAPECFEYALNLVEEASEKLVEDIWQWYLSRDQKNQHHG